MTGLLGGVFDPPHRGHVALVDGARRQFEFDAFVVLVVAAPGHKPWHAPAEIRLQLARAAFPDLQVELDPYPRTAEMLRARSFPDPVFVVGADEFATFTRWKEPDAVLELARLAVGTRPGHSRSQLEELRERLGRPDRVELFEIEPEEVSSSEIRALVARGEPVDGLVPAAVAAEIERLGLYRETGEHR